MDELDLAILRNLQVNARASVAEIAKAVGKPRTTVASRLEKLVESGVIKGFKTVLDLKRLGYSLTALVLLKVKRSRPVAGKSNQLVLAEELVERNSFDGVWIEEAHIITGQYDIVLKLRARSIEDLTKFLIVSLASFADVEQTETCISLVSLEGKEPIPVPGQPARAHRRKARARYL